MTEDQLIKPGYIIVANPYTDIGDIFNKSIIFIIAHDQNHSSGIIINKLLRNIDSISILKSLKIPEELTHNSSANFPIYFGGPVSQEKGIILHSNDYLGMAAIKLTSQISLSTDAKTILDIALAKGPAKKILAMGHVEWKLNQLVEEIKNNDWLVLSNENYNITESDYMQLIFSEDIQNKWNKALKLDGVDLINFSSSCGHA